MNRADLQAMAEERVKDAKALLDGGRWEFAYYVSGYAVECALHFADGAPVVGTAEQVSERVQQFEKAGVDLVLLQFSPQLEEMERFASEVIGTKSQAVAKS